MLGQPSVPALSAQSYFMQLYLNARQISRPREVASENIQFSTLKLAIFQLLMFSRQLAQSKKRTQLLESAWHKFVPDIDLAYALHAVETQTSVASPSVSEEAAPVPEVQVDSGYGGLRSRTNHHITQPLPPIKGELDKEDTLEWDETADFQTLTDGIGSLSVDPKGSGYMGPQSGNALLRYLQSISNFFPGPEDDQNDDRGFLNNHQLPPPQERLASSTFTHCCIDWYFKYYHSAYPILHEGFFRAQSMGEEYQHQRKFGLPLTITLGVIPKPKDGSWPLLMNIVLAIGAFTGPQSFENSDTYFFNKARENLNLNLLQQGSLPLVQAFALMANYMQKRNKPNSGFTYLGIAYNLALGIGLHREFGRASLLKLAIWQTQCYSKDSFLTRFLYLPWTIESGHGDRIYPHTFMMTTSIPNFHGLIYLEWSFSGDHGTFGLL